MTMICHPYEDRELVLEMMKQEAIEEAKDMNNATTLIPMGFESMIANFAQAAQAAKPQRKKRVTLLDGAMAQMQQGVLPEPVDITSEANLTYNTHMAKLYAFAKEGLRNAVEDYPIGGSNTYSRVVRGYRDLLIKWFDAQAAKVLDASNSPQAKPKALAKSIKANELTAVATKAKAKATPAKTKTTTAKDAKAPLNKD